MLVDPPGMRILIRLVLLACVIAGLASAAHRGRIVLGRAQSSEVPHRRGHRGLDHGRGQFDRRSQTGPLHLGRLVRLGSDSGPARRLQRDSHQRPLMAEIDPRLFAGRGGRGSGGAGDSPRRGQASRSRSGSREARPGAGRPLEGKGRRIRFPGGSRSVSIHRANLSRPSSTSPKRA